MRKILLIFIFILAFLLRFWQLGANPSSLDWDEASLGYNAYSILRTGKDEYGNFLPLSIRSFGDYKPPLYTYLTAIPVAIWGLNEFSTRFISAFFGALAVVVVYFLVKELFPKKSFIFYLLSFIFFALSPWHIQFSRIAFETNLGLFFFILGIYLFLRGLKQGVFYSLSFISFSLSMYAYHSPRLVVPVILAGLFLIYKRQIKFRSGWFVSGLIILFLLTFPIFKQLTSETGARFGSVTVINPAEKLGLSIKSIEYDQERGDFLGKLMHNRRVIYAKDILAGYLDHFNFDFLFLTGDAPGRHHAAGMGMLYFWDLPFVILGILYLLKNRSQSGSLIILWFLSAPLASSLTSGTPHAVRALLYLPTYQIFTTFGVVEFIRYLRKTKYLILAVIITFLFFIFNFFYYLHMYWVHTPVEFADWWQYGYREAVEEVTKLEKNYQKVIVTYAYDQPYVFFLFYKKIDPSWYQKNWGSGEIQRENRSFGEYEFRRIDWSRDQNLKNVLLIGAPKEIPENAAGLVKEIKFPDGSVAFRIVAR